MRMTNKIMQNNSLYNINNNKVLQDKLSTQMSTQKKITRPSDDPVVALRALRLRTSVSELTQYYEKNAPDAESTWYRCGRPDRYDKTGNQGGKQGFGSGGSDDHHPANENTA